MATLITSVVRTNAFGRLGIAILAVALAVASSPAHAATWWWNSLTTGLWTTGANWSNSASGGTTGTAPTNNTTSDVVVFNTTGTNGTVVSQLSQTQSIGGITVNNTGATTLQSDTTTARTLTIGTSGITINAGAGAFTIGASGSMVNVAFSAAQSWTNNSSNTFTVLGGITTSAATLQTLTVTGSGNTALSGVIGNGSGTTALTKTGDGTLTLSAGNTYTGTTSVNAGTLQIGDGSTNGSISSSSALALGGGSLRLTRSDAATQAFASTTLNAGLSTVVANANNTINFGTLTRNVGASLNIPTTGSFITSSANTNGILGGGITFGDTTWAVANGASAITGLTTYTLSSTAGTTAANYANANVDVDQSASPAAAITPNSLRFNTTGPRTLTLPSASSSTVPNGILVTANVGNNLSTITGGTIAGASGTSDLVVVQNNTANNLLISSVIVNNGTTGLTKSGAGVLALAGANAYTGTTRINAGTLQVGNNSTTGALAATSAITGASGATLAFNRTNTPTQGIDFNSVIGGAINVAQVGSGTLVLNGANTYTGTTGVNAGTLQIGGSGTTGSLATSSVITGSAGATLAFNRTNTVTQGTHFNSVIGGAINVSQIGSGTLVLNGVNTYTGTTGVNAGTLQIGDGTANGSVNSSSVLALGGGSLVINRSDAFTQTFASTRLSGGSTIAANAGNTVIFGAITRVAGGALDIPTTGSFITSSANSNGILGTITYGGTTWAIANGASAITGLATYTLSSTAGTTAANYANANIDVDQNASPAASITPNSLRFNTAGARTLTLSSASSSTVPNGILVTANVGNNLSTITGGTIAGSAGGDLVVNQNNTSTIFAIGSVIANNTSATGLTKYGAGVLALNAANTYTGTTNIGGGTLQIGNGGTVGSISTSSAITGVGGGTLAFSRTDDYGGSVTNTIGGGIGVALRSGTLSLSAANLSFTGPTTVDAGKLSVTLASGGNYSSPSIAIAAGAAFEFGVPANATYVSSSASNKNVISGSGTLVKSGVGSLALANALGGVAIQLSSGALIDIQSGTLASTNNNIDWTNNRASMNIASGATLLPWNNQTVVIDALTGAGVVGGPSNTIQGTGMTIGVAGGSGTFSGVITNLNRGATAADGNISKIGSGTQVFNGNNTYTGTTSVSGGTLRVTTDTGLGFGGLMRVNNAIGSTTVTSTATVDLAGVTVNEPIALSDGILINSNTGTASTVSSGLAAIAFSAGGSGYNGSATGTAALTITGGGGVGATATGTFTSGALAGITLTSAGSGYTSVPTISLPGAGTGAVLTSALSSLTLTGTANQIGGDGDLTINAAIGSTGGFTKIGNGTLTLSASNSFTGATTLNAGALQIGNSGTTGSLSTSSAITGSAGAMLSFNRTNTVASGTDFASTIGGALNVAQIGSGTLVFSGANTYTGTTMLSAGSILLSNTNAVQNSTVAVGAGSLLFDSSVTGNSFVLGGLSGTGGINLRNNASTPASITLTAGGNNASTTYQGVITSGGTGSSAFTKQGSGTLTLDPGAGQSSSVGAFSVTNGGVRLASGTLALTSSLSVGGGTAPTFTLDGGQLTSSGNSLIGADGSGRGTFTLTTGTWINAVGMISIKFGTTGDGSVMNVNGGLVDSSRIQLGQNGGTSTLNLNGGVVAVNDLFNTNLPTSVLNLNGGTLRAKSTKSNFIDLTSGSTSTVNVLAGGAIIDTNSSDITILMPLLSGTTNDGGLTKQNAGTLTLSAANTFTGATSISGGTLAFDRIAALATTSGITIGSGAGLTYTGTAGSFDRNITVSSGTGTVRNTGAGTLTLAGTLSKNGTVLRLQGGSAGINVTGIITGATPGSDLAVQNGLTTLSTANSYTGPTFINSSGTLALRINNAIPSNSAVTIGGSDAGGNGGPGRFNMGSFTNQIGSLSFSGSGGTIAMAPTSSATSTLVLSATGAVNLNGTSALDLTGMATGDGLYKLLAGSSLSGTFASVTGLNSNYLLRYGTVNANELDAQRKAEIGTITATPAAGSIITGGSTTFTFTVQNSTPAGGASLAPTFSAGSNVAGSATLASVAAASTSGSVSGFVFNGTSVGAGRTGLFTVNDSNAIAAAGTGSVSVNVYGHATPSLTSGTLTLGNIHVGYGSSGTSSNSLVATNGSGGNYIVDLKGSSSAASGNVSLNSIAGVAAGGSGSISATLATGRSAGAINESFTYTFADDSTLSGASANVGTATVAVTGNVYTGQSTWATNGGGNWGTLAGTGANAFGVNWGAIQGSPGLDSAFANTDTATFGSAFTTVGGTAAINTAGASISLKSLTFNNAAGSYEIYQTVGSGITLLSAGTSSAGITVAAGSHAIHADVTLGSNTVVDINAGVALTFHNAISGSAAFGLTKTGSGTLYFNGSNTYAGNTDIQGGLVRLLSGVNPLGTGTVTVRAGATLDLNNLALSNPLNVLSGGILLNTGSSQATSVSDVVIFSGTTNGTVTVGTGGNATFGSTVAGSVSVGNGAKATFTSESPLTGSLGVSSGGVVDFNGSNTPGSTFNVASGGLVNVGSGAAIGGQLHVSGSAVIAGSVASGADVVVEAGGNVKLVDGALFSQTSLTNAGQFIIDRSTSLSLATAISGSGSLQKTGAGTLFLSGSNGYTGATTISAGVVSIAGASALQSTSGVSIAGGAGLTYTGGVGTLDRPITVTGGVGTVTKSGAGTLTLAGTLTKNGTVLQLSGGAFNVTGQIVGSSANSDLYVNGASVTLSNTNSYNGPTYVFNSGTLALGVSNAIPSNSIVTLGASGTGSAIGPGTLDLGTSTNTISGLVFSGSGNTLKMAASQTAAPQLATNSSLSLGAGTTLDLTGMGTSAGLYKLVSYTSNSGTFTTVNGLATGYQLVYGTTELDAQQKAVLGTITVTNPVTSIITGGSAAFSYTVANGAASGGASLLFTGSGNANVAGSSSGSATAAGTSTSVAGLYFTGTGVGSGQTGTFNVNAPDAYGITMATGTVSVTVLDHATSSLAASLLTSTTVSLGTYNYSTHSWEAGSSTGLFTIHNLASQYGANLTADLSLVDVTGSGNGFSTNLLDALATIAGGTSSQFSIFFDPTGLSASGTQSTTFAITTSDKTGMSGAAASNTLYVTASVIVVPEPDTIIVAGIGIAIAGWSLWKRRRVTRILRRPAP